MVFYQMAHGCVRISVKSMCAISWRQHDVLLLKRRERVIKMQAVVCVRVRVNDSEVEASWLCESTHATQKRKQCAMDNERTAFTLDTVAVARR